MTYSFCTNIYDEHLELVTIYDFECEVDVEVIVSGGEVSTSINDVTLEGRSMFKGDEGTRSLAAKIAGIAEKEIEDGGPLWGEIQEAEGIRYRGLGGNDPDGHFVRVA